MSADSDGGKGPRSDVELNVRAARGRLTMKRLLEDKVQDASVSDRIVLAILSWRPSRATSVQKLGLLVRAAVEGRAPEGIGPHFSGGFDDDIAESLEGLNEEGYVFSNPDGTFALSMSGRELISNYLTDPVSERAKEATRKIAMGREQS